MTPAGSLDDDILGFWFGRAGEPDHGEPRRTWWLKDPAFDAEIRSRYFDHHRRALAGELDPMADTAEGALALVLLLDQFSRNMFRDQPESYAADEQARKVAGAALDAGFDQAVPPLWRWFFYVPFEHSCLSNIAKPSRIRIYRSLFSRRCLSMGGGKRRLPRPRGTGKSSPVSAASPTATKFSAAERRPRNPRS